MTLTIPAPRNVLCSYHFFKDYDLEKLTNLRICGDSGAFSAKSQGAEITTAELARWAKQWSHKLCWIAALDVIGDAEATRRNWHEMVDIHGVPGVPTIHFGCDPALMDYYVDRGVDFIGLGGMVGKSTAAQMRWLIKVFLYARRCHPQVRFHGWGVTTARALQLPFFSVDSSGWTSGVRYGRVSLRDPQTGEVHAIKLDGRSTYTPEVARLLAKHYGVSPSEVARSSGANRMLMVKLNALSASVLEQQFRRMHRAAPITTPSWGRLNESPTGPHQHLVLGEPHDFPYEETVILPEMANAEGPHIHLADAASNAGGKDIEAVNRLAEDGPHLHLSMTGRSGQEYDIAVLTGAHGPHLHLATMQINNAHPEQLDALAESGGTSADPTKRSAP